jgi:glycosyltransferase involved in cell wall biosynthesis
MVKGKVSVIIPCYNQGKYLMESVGSILNQSHTNWECVIVNDGSTDETLSIANQLSSTDSRIKVVTQLNMGLSSARNHGISSSNGEYILPLDADDKISDTYLEKALKQFEIHPNTKLVYCKADRFGDIEESWDLPEYIYENLIWSNCIFCSAVFKRADYDSTKGYNPNMKYGMEDWDFWLQLLKKDDMVYRIEETLFHYRYTGTSMVSRMMDDKKDEMYHQLVKNHPEIYSQYFNDLLVFHKKYEEVQRQLEDTASALLSVRASWAYRIGKIILKPFSHIRNHVINH